MFSAPVWAISIEEHLCGGHYRKKQQDKLRLRHLGLWQQIILSALPIASNRVKLQINPQAKSIYIYIYIYSKSNFWTECTCSWDTHYTLFIDNTNWVICLTLQDCLYTDAVIF